MELSIAKKLIAGGVNQNAGSQTWADFGAGDGLFTRALADLLPPESKITAVDKDSRALKNITIQKFSVFLQTLVADLNRIPLTLGSFDGIVMANSLHYIPDQEQFLSKLRIDFLKENGVLVLVEYDLGNANPWVPYPISKKSLTSLSAKSGFSYEFLPTSVKSKLNSAEIYSALLKPKP